MDRNKDFTIEAEMLVRRVMDIDDQLIVDRNTLIKLLEEEFYSVYSRDRSKEYV